MDGAYAVTPNKPGDPAAVALKAGDVPAVSVGRDGPAKVDAGVHGHNQAAGCVVAVHPAVVLLQTFLPLPCS